MAGIMNVWNKIEYGVIGNVLPNLVVSADTGSDKVVSIVEIVVGIFPWVGILFALWGAFKIVNAIRNDNNPEAISAGGRDLVVGVALILFKTLFWEAIKGLL